MSKFQTISCLRKELKQVNNAIDQHIIKGSSYGRLAAKHKMLVKKIDGAYRDMSFARTFQFLSLL